MVEQALKKVHLFFLVRCASINLNPTMFSNDPNDIPQVLNAFPKGVPNSTTLVYHNGFLKVLPFSPI
jgi:hypothetical protein